MRDFEPMDFSDYEPVGGPETGETEEAETVSVSLVDPLAGSRTYRLLAPLRVNGKVVRTIRMRHLRQDEIDGAKIRPVRHLIALACGLPIEALEALIWPDSQVIHQMFDDMLPLRGV